MRYLGLDIGERRIGVAVSDPAGRVATPLCVLDASKTFGDAAELRRLIDEYEAESVVVGLPLSMDGTEGPQARRIRGLAERLGRLVAVPVRFADERLSSTEATRVMRGAGLSERSQRGVKDQVAAAIFLQTYLDRGSDSRGEDSEQEG